MTLSRLTSGSGRGQTTHGYVLKTLRDAILDGTLPGGTRLIQAEIAAQLDVSITPVREALRDLAGEGIVELDPHRGSRVRRLDLREVRELYELRTTLEPLMVRRMITSMSEQALADAEQLLHRMTRTEDLVTWSELNRQFHALFAEPDKRSRLALILSGLRDSASPYVSLSLGASSERRAASDVEHAQLIEYYRARDLEGAVRLTIQHLNSTLATVPARHGHRADHTPHAAGHGAHPRRVRRDPAPHADRRPPRRTCTSATPISPPTATGGSSGSSCRPSPASRCR